MRQGVRGLAVRGLLVAVAVVCMAGLVTGTAAPTQAGETPVTPTGADTVSLDGLWDDVASAWVPMVRSSRDFIERFHDGAISHLATEGGIGKAAVTLVPLGHQAGRSARDEATKPSVGVAQAAGLEAVSAQAAPSTPGSPNGVPLTAVAGFLSLVVTGALLLVRRPLVRRLASRTGAENQASPGVSGEEMPTTAGHPATESGGNSDGSYVSDEERVVRLIEACGGRMRQAEIVERVEWSKAKVSRLLSTLDEDGVISKFRLGRENLICLRGHEPPASQTPFPAREGRDD